MEEALAELMKFWVLNDDCQRIEFTRRFISLVDEAKATFQMEAPDASAVWRNSCALGR